MNPSPTAFQPPVLAAPEPTKLEKAQVFAVKAQERLANVHSHALLNGYSTLVKIPAAEFGTVELFELYRAKGAQALFKAVDGAAGEKLYPFVEELRRIPPVLGFQNLTVPVEIPGSGPLVEGDRTHFEAVLKGVALAPVLDAHSTAKESDQEPDVEYALMAFRSGRKVGFGASSLSDLELGVVLQREGLRVMREVARSGTFHAPRLRSLIPDIQSVPGNSLNFVRLTDIELFRTLRGYESKGLSPEELDREKAGLAARYLKLRPYFEENLSPGPDFDLNKDVPELKGCELAPKEPDFLAAHNRWRAAFTEVAALEIILALEAHKLEKKAYPEKLDVLLKGYLNRMPEDLFAADRKFGYKKTTDGYLLETVSAHIPGHKNGRYRW